MNVIVVSYGRYSVSKTLKADIVVLVGAFFVLESQCFLHISTLKLFLMHIWMGRKSLFFVSMLTLINSFWKLHLILDSSSLTAKLKRKLKGLAERYFIPFVLQLLKNWHLRCIFRLSNVTLHISSKSKYGTRRSAMSRNFLLNPSGLKYLL